MHILSRRAKEAIKTALAMTIVYGIALWMGWSNPYWAGFSVAMISLATIGQSLNKGLLRMVAVFAAAACALAFLSWSFQNRWLMLFILTIFIGVCTYMLTGKKNSYFWFSVAYVCLIIIIGNGGNSAHAFYNAMARIGETGLGILVYALISVFIWPINNEKGLQTAADKLFSFQTELYQSCRTYLTIQKDSADSSPSLTQASQLLTHFTQVLQAAKTDSFKVYEVHRQWQNFAHNSSEMMETMEHLRTCFPELQDVELTKVFPDLDHFFAELDIRFSQIERMLTGNAPRRSPQTTVLVINKDELGLLSHCDKGAIALSKTELDRLEKVSRALFATVAAIRGYTEQTVEPDNKKRPAWQLTIDPDRMIAVVRVEAVLWISYLLWILVNPAGHTVFVVVSVTVAMMIAMMPMLPATALFFPIVSGCFYSGIVYLLIMPQLSGFFQLGTMIFLFTFGLFYLFSKPQQALSLLAISSGFLILTFIKNEQSYHFSSYANTSISLILTASLLIVCSYIPVSQCPEKTFLRLVRRFFKHSKFLLANTTAGSRKEPCFRNRMKTEFYINDLLALPVLIAAWGARIDHKRFPDNSPEQVQNLVTTIQELALRIKAVQEAADYVQTDHLLMELQNNLHTWAQPESAFEHRTTNPGIHTLPGIALPEQLQKKFTLLEKRSKDTFDLKDTGNRHATDYENVYRLFGSYCGLLHAERKYMLLASKINWKHWQEGRF